jgi:hypothetical protein
MPEGKGSNKKEAKKKDKEGEGKGKSGKKKGKEKEGDQKGSESPKSGDDSETEKKGKGKKGKEKAAVTEAPLEKADKAVQVPNDLEEVPQIEINPQLVPRSLRKEQTPRTILLRPLVGRKFDDEQTPIEEWKWPRKYSVWGSVEMYMTERATGGEDLDWVFWGKSDRICDSPHPVPPMGAKLKFLLPKDAKPEVPGSGQDQGEDPSLTIEEGKGKLDEDKSEGGGGKPGEEEGGKKKKRKK